MIFTETRLEGAFIIDIKKLGDERGFFGRSWCKEEMKENGLNDDLVQANVSFNKVKGTLRGMHYQESPSEEIKLIRCTRGAIYDVIIDLRLDSPTYLQWVGVELNEFNHRMLYVPVNFAHGFLTLKNDTEVFYQMSEYYAPECARGIRYDDPMFGIKWPSEITLISERDKNLPDYKI